MEYQTDGHYITLFAEQLTRTFEVLVLCFITVLSSLLLDILYVMKKLSIKRQFIQVSKPHEIITQHHPL